MLKYEFEGGEIDELSSQSPRPYISLFMGPRLFTHFSAHSLSSADSQTLMQMDQNNSFLIAVPTFGGLVFSSVY